MARILMMVTVALWGIAQPALADPAPTKVDVLVYGATPAGIAASIRAGQTGRSVLLVEPTSRIGGLATNGLSHTDFRTFEGYTGTFRQFTQRVEAYYRDKFGPGSQQVKDSKRGTHGEPHVNLLVFQRMLAEHKSIRVLTEQWLKGVTVAGNEKRGRHIQSVTLTDARGNDRRIVARVVIDASYEGDVMAAAGVEFHVGRESREKYGEPLAPLTEDNKVQGYNFRLVMTKRPDLRVPVPKPKGYRADDYAPLVPLLKSGRIKQVFCYPSGGIYKAQIPRLPNGKHDINDVSHGVVRLSLPQINNDWPNGDRVTRQRIFDEHVRHNIGMLYFLQNDPSVPKKFQDEARQWGFCKDEFQENGHAPLQLYVREARRMVGRYVFTEHDTSHEKDDARGRFQSDAVAMGDYGPNCHGTDHEGPRFSGKHTGEFYKRAPPYQIPYGVLLPKHVTNLLVPGAPSSSHVGFCALRLEPIWCAMGDAAGVAARLAVEADTHVQDVKPADIRAVLHRQGCATIYISDVREDSPDFQAVQWWAGLGGLHSLNPAPAKPGDRGKHLVGQYFHAFPGHVAELSRQLDDATRRRWTKLATKAGVPASAAATSNTRGEFIRAAFAAKANK